MFWRNKHGRFIPEASEALADWVDLLGHMIALAPRHAPNVARVLKRQSRWWTDPQLVRLAGTPRLSGPWTSGNSQADIDGHRLMLGLAEQKLNRLVKTHKGKDLGTRMFEAEALQGLVGEPEIRETLISALMDLRSKNAEPWMGIAVTRALGPAAEEPEVRDALLSLMRDTDVVSWLREAAAKALGHSAGEPDVWHALIAIVNDADQLTDVRAAAVGALGSAVDEPEVRRFLISVLEKNEKLGVWEQTALALGAVAEEPAVQKTLVSVLKDKRLDWHARHAAAVALGSAGDDLEVRKAALSILEDKDDDWQVREVAAVALGGVTEDAEVQTILLSTLLSEDENWWAYRVRQAAAAALKGIAGEPEVQEALLSALKVEDHDVRRSAAEALGGALGEPRVKCALCAVLADKNESWSIRKAAAEVLGGIAGEPDVQRILLSSLKDDDWGVRSMASRALRSMALGVGFDCLMGFLDSEKKLAHCWRELRPLVLLVSGQTSLPLALETIWRAQPDSILFRTGISSSKTGALSPDALVRSWTDFLENAVRESALRNAVKEDSRKVSILLGALLGGRVNLSGGFL